MPTRQTPELLLKRMRNEGGEGEVTYIINLFFNPDLSRLAVLKSKRPK